jgi:hypothetical protein
MALYWLNMKSRAAVTPCPGSGVSEQDWRVLKFWSVVAVFRMRLESTLLRIAVISGSVVTGLLGAIPTSTRVNTPTSIRLLLVSIRFIDNLLRG